MLSVTKFLPRGQGLAAVLLKRAASVELDRARRGAGRFEATDSSARSLQVALPAGSQLRDGDVLIAQDGSLVRVAAAPEAVLAVRACPAHGSPADLLRAAHALGRLQVELMVQPDHLLIAPDAALADRLQRQHLIVEAVQAPFEPDPGLGDSGLSDSAAHTGAPAAHVHGPHCRHGHGHGHDHHEHHDHPGDHGPADHGSATGHSHPPAAVAAPARGRPVGIAVTSAAAPHVHGPGCGHDHGGR